MESQYSPYVQLTPRANTSNSQCLHTLNKHSKVKGIIQFGRKCTDTLYSVLHEKQHTIYNLNRIIREDKRNSGCDNRVKVPFRLLRRSYVRSVAGLPYDSLTLLRATRDPQPIEVKLREMGVCSTWIFEIILQRTGLRGFGDLLFYLFLLAFYIGCMEYSRTT